MKRLILFALLVIGGRGHALPSYIAYGYHNCRSCHFNPLGGNTLNQYGRALMASEFSDHLSPDLNIAPDKLAKLSGFLGRWGKLPDGIVAEARFRGLYLRTGLEGQSTGRFIPMQMEGAIAVHSPDANIVGVVSLGYAPVPAATPESERSKIGNLISREHYFGVRPTEDYGVYAGFMDPAFGLRVPDHNAFLRSRTSLNMNDQSHGILVHQESDKWDGALHVMLGNLLQSPSVRQRGLSATVEFYVDPQVRLGFSGLVTASDFRQRQMAAMHARFGVSRSSSLLGQLTLMHETREGDVKWGEIFFLQSSTYLAKGLNLLMTFENYIDDFTSAGARLYRVGPGVSYRPWQRIELRADFQTTLTAGVATVSPNLYTLMGQINVRL